MMMQKSILDSKRIAKNTFILYFRQIITLLVTLYTSRVVLESLGVEDYGICNVVGGIITMLSFVTTTLSGASQRYLCFNIGSGDYDGLKKTFSLICLSYFTLTLFVVIITEFLGVYLVNYELKIPEERLQAANFVFQFTVVSFAIQMSSAPFFAVIMAHERMSIYSYICIFDVLSKLIIAYLIKNTIFDRLIVYSFLLVISSSLISFFYIAYSKFYFLESRFQYYYNGQKLKELCNYAWWNIIGAFANSLRSQGLNILLSIFFDPTINAARGIAYQVNNAIQNFSNNFFMAVKPQIVKSYAKQEYIRMHQLIYSSSRLSYYLILIIAIPIAVNAHQILRIWLISPPNYADIFLQFVLLNSLLEVFSNPLTSGIQATGKIKLFQLIVSTIYLSVVPISYLFLRLGFPPISTVVVNSIVIALSLIPRLVLCKTFYNLSIREYIKSVLLRAFVVTISCLFFASICKVFLDTDGLFNLILFSIVVILMCILITYNIGITSTERLFIKNLLTRFFENGKKRINKESYK